MSIPTTTPPFLIARRTRRFLYHIGRFPVILTALRSNSTSISLPSRNGTGGSSNLCIFSRHLSPMIMPLNLESRVVATQFRLLERQATALMQLLPSFPAKLHKSTIIRHLARFADMSMVVVVAFSKPLALPRTSLESGMDVLLSSRQHRCLYLITGVSEPSVG